MQADDAKTLREAADQLLTMELDSEGECDRGRLVQLLLRRPDLFGQGAAARIAATDVAQKAIRRMQRRQPKEGEALPGVLTRFDPPALICIPPAEPGAGYRRKRLVDATLGDIDLYVEHLQDGVKRDMVRIQSMQRMRRALAPAMRGNWFMTTGEAAAKIDQEATNADR